MSKKISIKVTEAQRFLALIAMVFTVISIVICLE